MAEKQKGRKKSLALRGGDKKRQKAQRGKSWFVGIGINHYQEFSSLNNAVRDVEDIQDLLINKYDIDPGRATILANEEATREGIIDQLDRLIDEIQNEDKLIIYYSGHGHLDEKTERGYWIPYDARKGKTASYIRNSTIRDYIKDIQSLHTLLISDSCFSGTLFVRGSRRSTSALDELETIPSRWALCSGRHNEEVFDGPPGKNSPFAECILDILNRNQKKALNVAKLADRVVEQTRANYTQLPEGNPLFGVGDKGGQYVFHLKGNEMEDWAACKAENTLEAFSTFLAKYPDGKFSDEANEYLTYFKEEEAWDEARQMNSLSGYLQYTSNYPSGKYKQEAESYIQFFIDHQQEPVLWQRTKEKDTLAAYEFYLEQYPEGRYTAKARSRIQELKQAAVEKQKQLQLEEEATWSKTAEEPSIKSLKTYLRKYPQEKHSAEARKQLAALQAAKREKQLALVKKHARWVVPLTAFLLLLFVLWVFTPLGKKPLNPEISFGSMTDRRDNQTYKTITINNLGWTWMAENLDYKADSSWCFQNDPAKCREYGRLYNWEAAMKACPPGWRLPGIEVWNVLVNTFGQYYDWVNGEYMFSRKKASKSLIKDGKSGFNALLGGSRDHDGDYSLLGEYGYYWSGQEDSAGRAFAYQFTRYYDHGEWVRFYSAPQSLGFSCRCIKGTPPNVKD